MSKHFSRKEAECRCGKCGVDTMDYDLVLVLEDLREHFDSPVTITSWNRCDVHNKSIGGSDNSQHTLGKAADVVVKDVKVSEVHTYLIGKYQDRYGIGLYTLDGFVHVDVRDGKGRWGS